MSSGGQEESRGKREKVEQRTRERQKDSSSAAGDSSVN